jgi:DNA-binding LytR/AlgR family response regulator
VLDMDKRAVVAVIAEDEAVLREELQARLETLWPELEVRAAVPDGHAALAALAEHRPQVLFLDIQMPGLSGIEVARQVGDQCHVVFVTAHDEFAVAAFEQGAIDYVMKPFSSERLAVAIERVKSRLASPPANLDGLLERLARQLPRPQAFLRWITRQRPSFHHGRRDLLLPIRYEVHTRGHRESGVADTQVGARARRGARSRRVLAGPPFRDREAVRNRRRAT